jgi:hypothetical protein
MSDARQRWKTQIISPYAGSAFHKEFFPSWLLQSVASEQREPDQEIVDSVLCQRSKLGNIREMMVHISQEPQIFVRIFILFKAKCS